MRRMPDKIDRDILDVIQDGFPISPEPYAEIAERLGMAERDVFSRIEAMRAAGIIRRLGGVFDSRKLGYTGTLVAMKVPDDMIEHVAATLAEYPEITHNYLRPDEFNVWFTLICRDTDEIERKINEIRDKTGIDAILNLPAQKLFKISTVFDMTTDEESDSDD